MTVTHRQALVFAQILLKETRVQESFFLLFPGCLEPFSNYPDSFHEPFGMIAADGGDPEVHDKLEHARTARERMGAALIAVGTALRGCVPDDGK